MASTTDWAFAYREQARVDLRAASALGATEPSIFAMLMQMAFEKFAKAALLRSGAVSLSFATSSHRAASRMVATMRLQKGLMARIGGPHVWSAALEVVEALERAHPSLAAGAGGPQLEYPWENQGAVMWPARDLPIASKLGNPRSNLAAHVIDFAHRLDTHFDEIFP
jgi:hypothetical protein